MKNQYRELFRKKIMRLPYVWRPFITEERYFFGHMNESSFCYMCGLGRYLCSTISGTVLIPCQQGKWQSSTYTWLLNSCSLRKSQRDISIAVGGCPDAFQGNAQRCGDKISFLGENSYLGSRAFELHNTEVPASPWSNQGLAYNSNMSWQNFSFNPLVTQCTWLGFEGVNALIIKSICLTLDLLEMGH